MKKMNDYKISIIFFSVALVLFGISMVTGLMPGLEYSIDKISMYLGFSAFGFGLVLLEKYKKYNDNKTN